jgi:thiol:disulfide interchange protein DsbD
MNEKSVFSKSQINALFEPYIFVKLYTDTVPPQYYGKDLPAEAAKRSQSDAEVNLAFQKKYFDNEQLPLYVVLEPQLDGRIRIVGVYDEGRINNEVVFAEFLKHPDGT